jgi:transcription initiation factor IIE alpha subunit
MKKTILMMAFAIATVTVVSCDKKAKTETTTEQGNLEHPMGEGHQMAYVCPMDCEKGKTYEAEGKCPTCGMALVEKKHTESDGHDHSKTKELTPEEKEHGHSHGEDGHDH